MEIVEAAEAYMEVAGDLQFDHTKIILRQNENYYYAVATERKKDALQLDLGKLNIIRIPDAAIWPPVPENLSIAPTPLPQDCFIKSPSLLDFGNTKLSENFGDLMLHEALVYEVLEKSPHTNVGRYFGCIVREGSIRGICLRKYDMTLAKYLKESSGSNYKECWMQVRNGVQHLHALGFVHCDLNPNNIMMNGDTPVIIDFDSCRKEGEKLGLKGGTIGWISGDFEVAERRIDEQSLEQLRKLMCG